MLQRVDAQWSQMAQVMNLAKVQSAIKRGEELPSPFMLTSILQRPTEGTAVPPASKVDPSKNPAKTVASKATPKQEVKPLAKEVIKPATATPPVPSTKTTTPPALPVVAKQAMSMEESGAHLSRGIEELSELVVGDASLGEVLLLTMKILMESLNARRVIISLRDKRTHTLVGRVGVGESGQAMANLFKIPVNPPSDLFGLLCAKSADTLISDSSDKAIVSRLPEWYTTHVNAPTFLILPLSMGVLTTGMIYADHDTPNSLTVDDQVFKRLKTLRNQLVMAMHMRSVE